MGKGAWIGIDDKARKIKNVWIGVDGVARKIKKMWIGIADKARLFFSGEGLVVGTATATPRDLYHVGASNNNYAVFAGANTNGGISWTVAYDSSLTQALPSTLSYSADEIAGGSIGNYALFVGGINSRQSGVTTVNAFDGSLTMSKPTALPNGGRGGIAGTSNNNYALFAGGWTQWQTGPDDWETIGYGDVDTYNASLTRGSAMSLNIGLTDIASGKVGEYAVFAGGIVQEDWDWSNKVFAYNASLVRSNPTQLNYPRPDATGASVGNYVLIAGGWSYGHREVDVYNTSLTHSTATQLSTRRSYMAGVSLGKYALFAGGRESIGTPAYNTIDVYDESLTRTNPITLNVARDPIGSAIGNKAIFVNGSTTVDVVTAS